MNSLMAACGHDAVPVFLGKLQGAVYKVAVDGHKLGIVALLEILPGEVVVLGLGSVGRKDISEHVLLAWQVSEILMEPYCPVA